MLDPLSIDLSRTSSVLLIGNDLVSPYEGFQVGSACRASLICAPLIIGLSTTSSVLLIENDSFVWLSRHPL